MLHATLLLLLATPGAEARFGCPAHKDIPPAKLEALENARLAGDRRAAALLLSERIEDERESHLLYDYFRWAVCQGDAATFDFLTRSLELADFDVTLRFGRSLLQMIVERPTGFPSIYELIERGLPLDTKIAHPFDGSPQPLLLASANPLRPDPQLAVFLLRRGASVFDKDHVQRTILHTAAHHLHPRHLAYSSAWPLLQIMDLALDAAGPRRAELANLPDRNGWTALMLVPAALEESYDFPFGFEHSPQAAAIDLLVDAGADVNARHEGRTALGVAIENAHPEAVRYLLRRGADPAGWERHLPNPAAPSKYVDVGRRLQEVRAILAAASDSAAR